MPAWYDTMHVENVDRTKRGTTQKCGFRGTGHSASSLNPTDELVPRNQGGGVLASSSTGVSAQIWRDFASRRRATSRREGSRDLDEKSSDLAKDLSKSSFRAHPVSHRRAREARNHADLYRKL